MERKLNVQVLTERDRDYKVALVSKSGIGFVGQLNEVYETGIPNELVRSYSFMLPDRALVDKLDLVKDDLYVPECIVELIAHKEELEYDDNIVYKLGSINRLHAVLKNQRDARELVEFVHDRIGESSKVFNFVITVRSPGTLDYSTFESVSPTCVDCSPKNFMNIVMMADISRLNEVTLVKVRANMGLLVKNIRLVMKNDNVFIRSVKKLTVDQSSLPLLDVFKFPEVQVFKLKDATDLEDAFVQIPATFDRLKTIYLINSRTNEKPVSDRDILYSLKNHPLNSIGFPLEKAFDSRILKYVSKVSFEVEYVDQGVLNVYKMFPSNNVITFDGQDYSFIIKG